MSDVRCRMFIRNPRGNAGGQMAYAAHRTNSMSGVVDCHEMSRERATHRPVVRRAARWIGSGLSVLLAVLLWMDCRAWALSFGYPVSGSYIRWGCGEFQICVVYSPGGGQPLKVIEHGFVGSPHPEIPKGFYGPKLWRVSEAHAEVMRQLGPRSLINMYRWGLAVPTWAVALAVAVPTCVLWWSWWRDRRRCRLGICLTCHYDLTGVRAGAVCPECGSPHAR